MSGGGQLAASFITDHPPNAVQRLVRTARQGYQVLGSVVVADAVDVMDVLVVAQQAAIGLFPHHAMLQNVPVESAAREGMRVVGFIDVDIPACHFSAPYEPGAIGSGRSGVVPSHIQHGVPGERVCRPATFGGNRGALSAPAKAEPMRRSIWGRLFSLAQLSKATRLDDRFCSQLVTSDEAPSALAPTPTFASRHMAPPKEGRTMTIYCITYPRWCQA